MAYTLHYETTTGDIGAAVGDPIRSSDAAIAAAKRVAAVVSHPDVVAVHVSSLSGICIATVPVAETEAT